MSELSKFSSQTRVAIYNRVSTEKKVQMEALDVQVAYTRKLVEDNHLTIVDQYIEPETGTEAEHRLEYQRMIRDIKADRIDLVVVKCSDRLCRDQAEWHNFVKLHLQKKFQLYFYLDDHIYDHERDDIKYSVQAIVDAEQSKITSKKIRDIHSNRQIYATGSKAMQTLIRLGSECGVYRREHQASLVDSQRKGSHRTSLRLVTGGAGDRLLPFSQYHV